MTDPIDTAAIRARPVLPPLHRCITALAVITPEQRDALCDEVDRLRAEVAQLDAICAAQRSQYRDTCGWKREAHRD